MGMTHHGDKGGDNGFDGVIGPTDYSRLYKPFPSPLYTATAAGVAIPDRKRINPMGNNRLGLNDHGDGKGRANEEPRADHHRAAGRDGASSDPWPVVARKFLQPV